MKRVILFMLIAFIFEQQLSKKRAEKVILILV